MSTLIEWLIVTLIAGGAGFALAAMNPAAAADQRRRRQARAGQARRRKEAATAKAEAAAVCGPGGPGMIDMPPIVTNVATPRRHLGAPGGARSCSTPRRCRIPKSSPPKSPPTNSPICAPSPSRDLQGPIGLENIRQDLRDRALVRSGGKVTDLLLKTLVLQ